MPNSELSKLTLYGDSISGNCQKPNFEVNLPKNVCELVIPNGMANIGPINTGRQITCLSN